MKEFQGRLYYDDRLFVLYLCKGTVEIDSAGVVFTTIYHENPPVDSYWCLVTYGNYANYPPHNVKILETKEQAVDYIKTTEPTTPLISLGGQSPQKPLLYEEYVKWKKKNQVEEYNYKKVYASGGSNHRECIMQTKEQFLKSNPNWLRI